MHLVTGWDSLSISFDLGQAFSFMVRKVLYVYRKKAISVVCNLISFLHHYLLMLTIDPAEIHVSCSLLPYASPEIRKLRICRLHCLSLLSDSVMVTFMFYTRFIAVDAIFSRCSPICAPYQPGFPALFCPQQEVQHNLQNNPLKILNIYIFVVLLF